MDFFRKINNGYNSSSQKETTLYEIRDSIARTYQQTIDYHPETLVDGELMPLIVMESSGIGSDKEQYRKLEAPPNSTFNLGSKVDCFGLKWLVTDINYNQELKLSGKMQLCNYTLKWQDADGDIVEEECVVTRNKTSATGVDEGRVITVNDTRRNVFVQFNPKTASLKQGLRFFIDFEGLDNAKVYALTDLNRTTYIYNKRGFFDLVCTEDQVNLKTDRPDLMLADYVEPKTPTPPSIGLCKILYSGEPVVKAGGSPKTFTAAFYDSNNDTISSITPTWELILPTELHETDKVGILSQSGNEIRIGANGDSNIGSVFTLKMSVNDLLFGDFECEINVTIDELW